MGGTVNMFVEGVWLTKLPLLLRAGGGKVTAGDRSGETDCVSAPDEV